MTRLDESGDSDDLQMLFDSIAGAAPSRTPPAVPEPSASGDSDDLQALFDSVAAESSTSVAGELDAIAADAADTQEAVFNRIGQMARALHNNLRELGYDKILQDTASQIPDARNRLDYIARMTEQAASKVLAAAEIAKPIADDLGKGASELSGRWEKMFANQLSVEEFKALAADTRAYFGDAPIQLATNSQQLTEIMLAQDFQDLTGQVIKKVVDMVQEFETRLIKTLIEVMPEAKRAETGSGLLNGPVISAVGRDDVLTDQGQVDDLLESLGF